MILTGFLLFFFALDSSFFIYVLAALAAVLIGAGVAGLMHTLTRRTPFGGSNQTVFAWAMLSLVAAAIFTSTAGEAQTRAHFQFAALSFYFSFLGGLLILTITFMPKASIWRHTLLAISWLMIILGLFFFREQLFITAGAAGLGSLTLLLLPAGPIIDSPKFAQVFGFIFSAIIIIASLVALGTSTSNSFNLVYAGGLAAFSLIIFTASFFGIRIIFLSIGLLVFGAYSQLALGPSAGVLPLLPIAVLFLFSAFTIPNKKTSPSPATMNTSALGPG